MMPPRRGNQMKPYKEQIGLLSGGGREFLGKTSNALEVLLTLGWGFLVPVLPAESPSPQVTTYSDSGGCRSRAVVGKRFRCLTETIQQGRVERSSLRHFVKGACESRLSTCGRFCPHRTVAPLLTWKQTQSPQVSTSGTLLLTPCETSVPRAGRGCGPGLQALPSLFTGQGTKSPSPPPR